MAVDLLKLDGGDMLDPAEGDVGDVLRDGDITVLPPFDPQKANLIRYRFLKLLHGLSSGGRPVKPGQTVFQGENLHQYFPYQEASADMQQNALSITHGELHEQIRIVAEKFRLDRENVPDGADVANASMILLIAKSHVLESLTSEIAKVEGIEESVAARLVKAYGPEIDRFFWKVLGTLQGVDLHTDSDRLNALCVELFRFFNGIDIKLVSEVQPDVGSRLIVDVQEAVERAWMGVLGGVEVTEDMREDHKVRRFLPEAGTVDLQHQYSDLMRFMTNRSNLDVLQKMVRRIMRVENRV